MIEMLRILKLNVNQRHCTISELTRIVRAFTPKEVDIKIFMGRTKISYIVFVHKDFRGFEEFEPLGELPDSIYMQLVVEGEELLRNEVKEIVGRKRIFRNLIQFND